MSRTTHSILEQVRTALSPAVVGKRARRAFPSKIQAVWNFLLSYRAALVILAIILYAGWYGIKPATVIAPFHIPAEDKNRPLPFSGEAVADSLRGAITSIDQEAAGHKLAPPCDAVWLNHREFGGLRPEPVGACEVPHPVSVEVKGLSPEGIKSLAREALGTERYISGDVIRSSNDRFQLFAQATESGPWITDPQELSADGLRRASCELAERILGSTNRDILAAAWIRRQLYDKVIDLYGLLPADTQNTAALNNLGVALREKGDYEAATEEFKQALAINDNLAHVHYNLGVTLKLKHEDGAAIDEFRRAIKLDRGFAAAYYNLGLALADAGREDDAIAAYRRAADLGQALAMNNLGWIFAHSSGANKNPSAALAWYKKAAEAGNTKAMMNLAWLNRPGRGIPASDKEALAWLQKAAQLGDPDAMSDLGHFYENGWGVERSDQRAFLLYRQAAAADSAQAMTHLAAMYGKGLYVKKDASQAFSWYQKAADKGNTSGMTGIGFMYENGYGVKRDYQKAILWYRKAADAGNTDAMINIGAMYEDGRGVKQDLEQAVFWYSKATQLGSGDAAASLAHLKRTHSGTDYLGQSQPKVPAVRSP